MSKEHEFYVTATVEAGDNINYGDIHSEPKSWHDITKLITEFPNATGSDYSGGSYTRSNYLTITEDEELKPFIITAYGGHGTYAVYYVGSYDDAPKVVQETHAALASYPILDEHKHSELEHELEMEAWTQDGLADFKKALMKRLNEVYDDFEHDTDAYESKLRDEHNNFRGAVRMGLPCGDDESTLTCDELLRWLWGDASDRHGDDGVRHEEGCTVFFYTHAVTNQITDAQLAKIEPLFRVYDEELLMWVETLLGNWHRIFMNIIANVRHPAALPIDLATPYKSWTNRDTTCSDHEGRPGSIWQDPRFRYCGSITQRVRWVLGVTTTMPKDFSGEFEVDGHTVVAFKSGETPLDKKGKRYNHRLFFKLPDGKLLPVGRAHQAATNKRNQRHREIRKNAA